MNIYITRNASIDEEAADRLAEGNLRKREVSGLTMMGMENARGRGSLLVVMDPYCRTREEVLDVVSPYIAKQDEADEQLDLEEVNVKKLTSELDELFSSFEMHAFLSEMGLASLSRVSDDSFSERILKENNLQKAEALAILKEKFLGSDLKEEIKRIYSHMGSSTVVYHPCAYIVLADTEAERKETIDLLLDSLLSQKRLHTRRVGYVTASVGDGLEVPSIEVFNAYYPLLSGGALILDIAKGEKEQEAMLQGVPRPDKKGKGRTSILERLIENKRDILPIFSVGYEEGEKLVHLLAQDDEFAFLLLKGKTFRPNEVKRYLKKRTSMCRPSFSKAYIDLVKDDMNCTREVLEYVASGCIDTWMMKNLNPNYPLWLLDRSCAEDTPSPKEANPDEGRDGLSELSSMIGLGEAKRIVNEAIVLNEMLPRYKASGITNIPISRHMVFTGNPGTAKTTVARLFAKVLKEKGILKKGDLIEVGRSDLVGKFVGHTAPLVKEVFRKARGSVLFIDEAYSLLDDRAGLFGDEAINTIVQEMENHRDDVVVIFAGYPDKMKDFVERNPGLRSRLSFFVPFSDYSEEELWEILLHIAGKSGMTLEREAKSVVLDIIEREKDKPDFGNGRFMRSLFEKAVLHQAGRLLQIPDAPKEAFAVLKAEDFVLHSSDIEKKEKRIGFFSPQEKTA